MAFYQKKKNVHPEILSGLDLQEKSPINEALASNRHLRRTVQATALVAIWMALGWVWHLEGYGYLLIGVPLVAGFQILVRKKPLVSLWVRNAEHFRLNRRGAVLSLAFAIMPTIFMARSFAASPRSSNFQGILWGACCVAGAFGVGFSLSHFTRETWKSLLVCLTTAGVIGCGIMIGSALLQSHGINLTFSILREGMGDFFLFFPVCFVLEEVAFRGAIDSHVHHAGDKHPRWSALYVSGLWGLWHLPILGETKFLNLIVMAACLPLLHMVDGMFLSLGWRRSGNLAVPAAVHALIDAVRDTVMKG